jgi:hypothetical protein
MTCSTLFPCTREVFLDIAQCLVERVFYLSFCHSEKEKERTHFTPQRKLWFCVLFVYATQLNRVRVTSMGSAYQGAVVTRNDTRPLPENGMLRLGVNYWLLMLLVIIFSGSAAQCGLWLPRSRSFLITNNDAPQSVGLFWTSDQLVAETSTWQHTQQTNNHAPDGIRNHDRSRRTAVDRRLRPRGHWDRC